MALGQLQKSRINVYLPCSYHYIYGALVFLMNPSFNHIQSHIQSIQSYKQGTYVACGTGKLFCEKKKKSIYKYIHIGLKFFNENFLASS